MRNNILTQVMYNGKLTDGLVAAFPIERDRGKDWVVIAISEEAEHNVGITMAVRVEDLQRLLGVTE